MTWTSGIRPQRRAGLWRVGALGGASAPADPTLYVPGGSMLLQAGTPTVNVAANIVAFAPTNPNFATQITATSATDHVWSKEIYVSNGTNAFATVSSGAAPSALTAASTAAQLAVKVAPTSDLAVAAVLYRFLAGDFVGTSGVLTWDAMYDAPDLDGAFMTVLASDAGGTTITDSAAGKNAVIVFGSSKFWTGAYADTALTAVPTTQTNVKVTHSVDLKAFATATLLSGKTWADVAKVQIKFGAAVLNCPTGYNAWKSMYLNGFR